MSAIGVLAGIKKFFEIKKRTDVSSTCLKLHRWTAALLILFSVLTSCKQFFGHNINCMLGSGSAIPPGVFESYCFMSGTYTLPVISSNLTTIHHWIGTGELNAGGSEEGTKYHNYYQWVPILVALQAALCYLPWHIWKGVEGGKVEMLLSDISQEPITEISLSDQVSKLANFLITRGGWFASSARWMVLCQFLCLVSSVSQMYFMNAILQGDFLGLGFNLFSVDLLKKDLVKVFPTVVKCSMSFVGPSGNVVNNSGLCTLPINILNEKMYLVLWVWFLLITTITCLSFLLWLLLLVSPSFRQMQLQRLSPSSPTHTARSVANQSFGDFVLLALIANNVDSATLKALYEQLSDDTIAPRLRKF